MSTLEYHYQTMGRILSHLVNSGLSRVDFDQSNAMEIMTYRIGDEQQVLETFSDVLKWMSDEGLIRSQSINEFDGGYIFLGVQLTSKGLSVIHTRPNDPELGESIEKKVSNKEDLNTAVYTKMGAFVGSLLGGFTETISGA